MVDSSSSELLQELNENRKKTRFLPFAIVLAIVFCVVMFVFTPIWLAILSIVVAVGVCWFASIKDALHKTTVAIYDLEPDIEMAYQQLHDAFDQLRSCSRTWHISARGDVIDRKYHAGADSLIKRQPVVLRKGEPPSLKTNLEIPMIPVGREVLAFMPDRILVFAPDGVGSVGYEALGLEFGDSKFVEEEALPSDAIVIGTTWRYVNKKGGPDRRFKDNREIPICAYEQLRFWSTTGLNEIIQISRKGVANLLRDALSTMGNIAGSALIAGTELAIQHAKAHSNAAARPSNNPMPALSWPKPINPPMSPQELALSAGALKLVTEKPRGWEHRLFAQVMLDEVRKAKRNLARGNIAAPETTDIHSLLQFLDWTSERVSEHELLVDLLSQLNITNDNPAFGPPGQPGSVTAIVSLSRQVGWCCQRAADWSQEIAKTPLDLIYHDVARELQRFAEVFVASAERFAKQFLQQVEDALNKPPGTQVVIDATLKLDAPDQTQFQSALDMLKIRTMA